ncbi:MAG: hypothetical protein ACXVPL_06105 [Actinomycetota bacterium]
MIHGTRRRTHRRLIADVGPVGVAWQPGSQRLSQCLRLPLSAS